MLLSGVKKWDPEYKDLEDGKIMEQNQLNRLQRVQFECPKYRNSWVAIQLAKIWLEFWLEKRLDIPF